MKVRKNVFCLIVGVMLWGIMSTNIPIGMAVGRSVKVDNDTDFENSPYSVGATNTDSGAILCNALSASYQNTKHSDKYKELEYSYYKIQVSVEIRNQYQKTSGNDSYISVSGMSPVALALAYKRYAYGATHRTSSSSSGIIGNAFISITRDYPTDGVLVKDELMEENSDNINADIVSEGEEEFFINDETTEYCNE